MPKASHGVKVGKEAANTNYHLHATAWGRNWNSNVCVNLVLSNGPTTLKRWSVWTQARGKLIKYISVSTVFKLHFETKFSPSNRYLLEVIRNHVWCKFPLRFFVLFFQFSIKKTIHIAGNINSPPLSARNSEKILWSRYYYCFCIAHPKEETAGAQRGWVTCPRTHSQYMHEPAF